MDRFVCWKKENVRDIIDPLALNVEASFLLATHTPFKNLVITCNQQQKVAAPTEESLLESILEYGNAKNCFVIIEGAPGTGKSNLIWWFSHKLEQRMPSAKVILIKRSEASLARTLKSLVNNLGENFKDLATDFSQAANNLFTKTGLKHNLLDQLVLSLRPGALQNERQLPSELRRLRPWIFLKQEYVGQILCGEEGVISRLIERITAREHDYEGIVQFKSDDLILPRKPEFGRMEKAAQHLAIRLIKDPDLRKKLTGEINERLNRAISGIIDLTGDKIYNTFDEIRRRLGKGKKLVMLIEDVATFQGVDRNLINYFSEPKVEKDLCNIISVVGITNDYYASLRPNILPRITHHAQLEEGAGKGLFINQSSLSEFAARYLNAVRLGSQELKKWHESINDQSNIQIPNSCTDCKCQVKCHQAFGTSPEGYGLYPFTEQALWNCLKSGKLEHKNPRTVLINILQPILRDGCHTIPQQKFPPDQLTKDLERPNPKVADAIIQNFIDKRIPKKNIEKRSQYESLIRYYGDGTVQETKGKEGTRLVGGVPATAFEIFGLKLDFEGFPPGELPEAIPVEPHDLPTVEPLERPAGPPEEFDYKLQNLGAWSIGDEQLDYIPWYRQRIWNALKEFIDWDSNEFSEHERDRLVVTDATIRIENQLAGHLAEDRTICFQRNSITRHALESLLRFHFLGRGSWVFEDSLESQRALITFLRLSEPKLLHFLRTSYGEGVLSRDGLIDITIKTLVWSSQILGIFQSGMSPKEVLEKIAVFEFRHTGEPIYLGEEFANLYQEVGRNFATVRQMVFDVMDKKRGDSRFKFLDASELQSAFAEHADATLDVLPEVNISNLRCSDLWDQMFRLRKKFDKIPGLIDAAIEALKSNLDEATNLIGEEKPEDYSMNAKKIFELGRDLNMAGPDLDGYRDSRIRKVDSHMLSEMEETIKSLDELKTTAQKLDFCLHSYPDQLNEIVVFLRVTDCMKKFLIQEIKKRGIRVDLNKQIAEIGQRMKEKKRQIDNMFGKCFKMLQ